MIIDPESWNGLRSSNSAGRDLRFAPGAVATDRPSTLQNALGRVADLVGRVTHGNDAPLRRRVVVAADYWRR